VKSGNAKHILIVEDSPDLQLLLAKLFGAEGYSYSQAFNGREALELLKSNSSLPALILLDIMMPIMGGIEFHRELAKNSQMSKIPVIVMTADSNFQAEKNQMGVAAVVRKPIEIDSLLELVRITA
jgi:CheY-like chemotaxis protein